MTGRLSDLIQAAQILWDTPATRKTAQNMCARISDFDDWQPANLAEEITVIAAVSAAMVASIVSAERERGGDVSAREIRAVFGTLHNRAVLTLIGNDE